jgi:hypothetical protein
VLVGQDVEPGTYIVTGVHEQGCLFVGTFCGADGKRRALLLTQPEYVRARALFRAGWKAVKVERD